MKPAVKILCAAALAIGAAGWWVASQALATYRGEAVRISVGEGTSPEALDSLVCAATGADFGGRVMHSLRLLGGDAGRVHGSFLVEPDMRAVRLARNLQHNLQQPLRFTFNNVRTLSQLADRAGEAMEFSAADFLAACDSILPARGYKGSTEYPAAFLPDSYEFYWTASPEAFVRKLADARDAFWTPERRSQAQALGLRPVEVATIASIAEEETAAADERPIVARLYINRLQKGMKLQADPTVKFGIGDFSLRRITARHLAVESPYNTYLHAGLPPGPIRIADAATLRAVLTAPQHSYLFMCAKEDFSGRHNFATDAATHMANARRYRAALNTRGIH